ncbi:redoxin domain-containing protein [Candidatus Micrarchaeota archaeon]|nr:redoxin domain-containing protein [Candidatus Micrarchaeota archaeon]
MFGFKIKAPEFADVKWLNSKPVRIKDLKGKVILINFWTSSSINCHRTMPYLKKWHQKYHKKGLAIIGIHSPEFAFEEKEDIVKKAVRELGLKYPVCMDNKMRMWSLYNNRYWPATFLIDKEGNIEYVHFGEGMYEDTEDAIQILLGIQGKKEKENLLDYMFDQTPQTYAGFLRNRGLGSGLISGSKYNYYVDRNEHVPGIIYPDGRWEQEKEYIELKNSPGKLSFRFNAREVNIVIVPLGKSVRADIFIDNRKKKAIAINKPGIYNVFRDKKYRERDLGLVFRGKARVYVFTFG